jgi:siroheme synthase (precorrin-2 oxidase/ferrochelatase)
LINRPKIIAKRSMFPDSAAKRPDLVDVVFPTWIDREKGLLFAGISDVAVGVTSIRDPFAAAAGIS